MKKINVGLIGLGNVGRGVVKILADKRRLLTDKIGMEINIKKICDKDLSARRGLPAGKCVFVKNPTQVLNDPQIDIVVELIGGIHPAKEYIGLALKNGKSVVTANKALLSREGKELFKLAEERGKNIYFESSVGAGIPIIKSLREGLVANRFNSIFGIVNGTSNFMLSQMSNRNCAFREALKEARHRGFAEKNAALDIEGIDSAHKLILLTFLSFGRLVDLSDVYVEGISRISLDDINYAKELGFEIKLLAIAKKEEGELEVRVHPTFLPKEHLLSSVSGVNNAIYVSCDLAGDLLFYGPGAGQRSAASAVVADLVDLTQDIKAGLFRPTLRSVADGSIKRLRKIDQVESKYYIRFMAADKPGVLAKIAGVLAKFKISIASVTQKQKKGRSRIVPIVMVIHEAREKSLHKALEIIGCLGVIKEKPVAIRMEEV
ncbi:homoserine dehydrogenase [Candidatus Omnitrophota bacterium]